MAQPNRSVLPTNKAPVKVAEPEEPQSKVAWILGWVVIPGLFFGGLFVGGVYVGANNHDGWIASAVMWLFGLVW